jgi:hypothetical protein
LFEPLCRLIAGFPVTMAVAAMLHEPDTLQSPLGITMSTRIRPRWIEPDIDGIESEGTRPSDRIGESTRSEWSIPDDPREQRRVRNR